MINGQVLYGQKQITSTLSLYAKGVFNAKKESISVKTVIGNDQTDTAVPFRFEFEFEVDDLEENYTFLSDDLMDYAMDQFLNDLFSEFLTSPIGQDNPSKEFMDDVLEHFRFQNSLEDWISNFEE